MCTSIAIYIYTCVCVYIYIYKCLVYISNVKKLITCLFLKKKKGDVHCLPQLKRDGFSCLIILTPMGLGKP